MRAAPAAIRSFRTAVLVAGASVGTLGAQTVPKVALESFVPVSDVRADWLSEGVESPNGRFYLLRSYASNDSGFLRYDRQSRSWAYLGRGNVGNSARWSPNGRFVAYLGGSGASRDRYLWLLPMDTVTGLVSGSARRVSARPAAAGSLAWSPDGRRIAFVALDSGRAAILSVPFNGGDEQALFQTEGHLAGVVWSRDARTIFVNHGAPNRPPRTLKVSLDDKRTTDLGEARAPIIDISPDGRWLAQYHFSTPILHLLATDGKQYRRVDLQRTFSRLTPTGWRQTSPSEIVALDHIVPEGIQRVSVADGRIRTVVAFDSAGLGGGTLSPDERQLAYIRIRDGVTQLVVADTSGGNVRVLVEGARRGSEWSPTAQHIMFSTDETDIRIVDVASKQVRELLPAESVTCAVRSANCDGRVTNFRWRSDGRAVRYFERRSTKEGRTLELREVGLDGRQRIVTTTTVAGIPSFIARNDTLFLVSQPNVLHVVNTRTGITRVIHSGGSRRVEEHVDANGQWILIVAESGGNGTPLIEQPLLISLTTGEAKKYPYALGGEVSHGNFLPDGRNFLLTACVTCRDPGYVEKWDVILTPMNGDPPRILTGGEPHFKDFWPVAFTRDGRTVYFSAQQSYNTRIVTITLPKF